MVRVTYRGESITLSEDGMLAARLDELKELFNASGRGEAIYRLLSFSKFLDKLDEATPELLIKLRRVIALFFEIGIRDPNRFETVLRNVEDYLEIEFERAKAKRAGLWARFKELIYEADRMAMSLITFGEKEKPEEEK